MWDLSSSQSSCRHHDFQVTWYEPLACNSEFWNSIILTPSHLVGAPCTANWPFSVHLLTYYSLLRSWALFFLIGGLADVFHFKIRCAKWLMSPSTTCRSRTATSKPEFTSSKQLRTTRKCSLPQAGFQPAVSVFELHLRSPGTVTVILVSPYKAKKNSL